MVSTFLPSPIPGSGVEYLSADQNAPFLLIGPVLFKYCKFLLILSAKPFVLMRSLHFIHYFTLFYISFILVLIIFN